MLPLNHGPEPQIGLTRMDYYGHAGNQCRFRIAPSQGPRSEAHRVSETPTAGPISFIKDKVDPLRAAHASFCWLHTRLACKAPMHVREPLNVKLIGTMFVPSHVLFLLFSCRCLVWRRQNPASRALAQRLMVS